ncbi:MAG: hypothetical protein HYV18_07670 [Gammaproteobacteria bacterium]|nr:hypothetical protein [Gammaproteobacteria bacterium]
MTAPSPSNAPAETAAARLNRDCRCIAVDRAGFLETLHRQARQSPGTALLAEAHNHLVAELPVFVAQADADAIRAAVAALHTASQLPGYAAQVAALRGRALPADFGPLGGILGLDFHLTADGPRLIEINTNAGGALINAAVAEALRGCCAPVEQALENLHDPATMRSRVLDTFRAEWRLQRGAGAPGRVAIVDREPARQYLYPEFLLFESLFEQAGWSAAIADPVELEFRDGRLLLRGEPVDLVYNRLTDFALDEPAHAALRAAYESGAAVVTPHPRAHALLADKRLLPLLGDARQLQAAGLSGDAARALARVVPPSRPVDAASAGELYEQRRRYYFKPARGYGSKATYDGAKLTRKVWDDIAAGDYVAQERVPPSERVMQVDGAATPLKLDLRAYAYAGQVLFMAARLYRGQTTNFRTPGGGFAPVIELPPTANTCC